MSVETVTPTEAELQRAHELWNEILCNGEVPGWTARGAIAQALAEQRAEIVGRYEALAYHLTMEAVGIRDSRAEIAERIHNAAR